MRRERTPAVSEVFRLQAEIARVLANPVRLRLLDLIGDREVANADLLRDLGISKANLAQHLALLRRSGMLSVRREGLHAHYRVALPEILDLCMAMRRILARHLTQNARLGKRLLSRAI